MPEQITLKPFYIRCAVTIVAAAALSMTGAPRSAGEEAKRGTSAKAGKVQPFVHDDSRAAAASYAKWLKGAWTPNGMSARNHIRAGNQILAAGDNPDVAARRFARAAVTDTNSSEAWRGLARALLAKPPASLRGNQRYATPRNAAGAAHRAYDLAKTDKQKALALATLAEALKRRSYWRPALDALKTSLALNPSPAVAARYARMREQHGFRIVNYDVEVERAAPRLCIRFSEDLRSGAPNASVAARFDYTSFVALDGKDPQSLSIEGARLCVNGLIHGETHTVRAREGLPARIDDALAKTVDLRIFVKDRAPSVRASAKRFVLPMNGQNGIPLTTINTSQLDIEIYRIGDRGILRALNDGTVGRNLQQWDRETLTRERGRKVYEGSLSTRSKRNAEVTTAVPVREAIPDFKPGIYAMHAKPSGTETTNGNGATQWFVLSDLGLTAIKAKDGVHVFVKSLTTARNVGAAKIKLVSRSNEVLGTGTSDADGRYSFAAGLTRGEGGMAPALVTVEHADGGFAFLNLTEAAFDLTDRGVKGRNAPGPIDAFMYTDRGVYRAGETVHLSALVRSASGRASKLPTTLVVTRPDGVVFKRTALANQSAGGRTIALLIPKDAMRGTWRMKLHIDPKQPAIANASVLVEDFLPERLALSLATPDADRVEPGKPTRISIEGRYLYGPAAADLAIEGDTIVGPASDGDPDHKGFHFGDTERRITPVRTGLGTNLRTSADGTASVAAKLPPIPRTVRPLAVKFLVRLRESGGRTIERSVSRPIAAAIPRVGIKPQFKNDRVSEDAPASFSVIALDRANTAVADTAISWRLLRLERQWQWYKRGGSWRYEAAVIPNEADAGEIRTDASGTAQLALTPKWGQYRIELTRSTGSGDTPIRTTYKFASGWVQSADADSPEVLDVAVDRARFAPGETATVRVTTRKGGRATVAILGNGLHAMKTVEIASGDTEIPITVGRDWGAGAYAAVMLHRPMDTKARRMPTRALGLVWIGRDTSDRTLKVALEAPKQMRSARTLNVPIAITGAAPGERTHVTIAAVDVGILNVTRFKAPTPANRFGAQTQLGAEIRDVYGRLIDGMTAERGTMRAGGDADASLKLDAAPPMWKTVAKFSGIVTTDADGRANVSFDMPEFAGTVKLMAVAWTDTKTGSAAQDVIVRDPLTLSVATPRFMTLGDTAELTLDVHNVDAPAGDFDVSLSAVQQDGPVRALLQKRVSFKSGERRTVRIPVIAERIGTMEIIARARAVTAAAPNQEPTTVTRRLSVTVNAGGDDISRTRRVTLKPGGSLTIDSDHLFGLVRPTAQLAIDVGAAPGLNVPALLTSLDRYPYGCTEQTISRALPLLYANAIGLSRGQQPDTNLRRRITDAVQRVLARQDSSGAFGLWSPTSPDLWLTSYAGDFLSRARDEGYSVPDAAARRVLDRLSNFVGYTQSVKNGGRDLAYALYVLARNGRVPAGELRYYGETKLAAFSTPTAKAQLGAALTMIGDAKRARPVFDVAAKDALAQLSLAQLRDDRTDFGSGLRDLAAVTALATEAGFADLSNRLAEELSVAAGAKSRHSTQEQAWLLLAARAIDAASDDRDVSISGESHRGRYRATVAPSELAAKPVVLRNPGTAPLSVTLTATGAPLTAEPAASNGFQIERRAYTLEGRPLKLTSLDGGASSLTQNQKFVMVVTVTAKHKGGRVLLVDRLPAGLEIENPSLVDGGSVQALAWLKTDIRPEHTEFRDDRFVGAYSLFNARTNKDGGHSFSAAYIVRAVTPGSFTHPAATVEDMYRPERFARSVEGQLTITRKQ